MKTCEDKYLVRRQKQRRIALRCTGTAAVCCAAVLIAYPLLSGRQTPEESGLTGDVTTGVPGAIVTVVPDELTGSPNGKNTVTKYLNDRPAGALTGSPPGGLDGDVTNAPSGVPNSGALTSAQTAVQQTETVISATETTSQAVPTITSQSEPPVITTEPVEQNTEKPVNTALPETTRNGPEQMYNQDGNPIPHWDEKSFDQKYGWAGFGELGAIITSYFPTHETADSAQIGEQLGRVWLGGYDEYTDEYKHCDAEAYALIGMDSASEIAVKSPDDAQYYLFRIHDPLAGADDSPSGGDGN